MTKRIVLFLIVIWIALSPLSSAVALAAGEEEVLSTETVTGPNGEEWIVQSFEQIETTSSDGVAGCKLYTRGVSAKNVIGQLLLKYSWKISWCYDGTKITSLNRSRQVFTNYGWAFLGDIADNTSGGVNSASFWGYAQGDFCFFPVGGSSCILHLYPWVEQNVYKDGNFNGSSGF